MGFGFKSVTIVIISDSVDFSVIASYAKNSDTSPVAVPRAYACFVRIKV